MTSDRRTVVGAVAAIALVVAFSAVMLPLRSSLSVATDGLVLVVPVVSGVVIGGLGAGIVAVVAGFLAYDLVFIPPYGTLAVGVGQNWVALVVYVVVLVLVAAVVADQRHARAEAYRREIETRRLFELSEALVVDGPGLYQQIVDAVAGTFHPTWVALLLPADGALAVAAHAGAAAPSEQLASLVGTVTEAGTDTEAGTVPHEATTVHLLEPAPAPSSAGAPAVVAMVAGSGPVGMLAVAPAPANEHDRRLLATFANQAALAITRTELRAQAVQSERLEAAEEARRILLRTVSHDLRTPLATIKAALSDVLDPGVQLPDVTRDELVGLAEAQADRLDRMVANLLDMTRVEAGALQVRPAPAPVDEIVGDALATLSWPAVAVEIPDDLPPVVADHTLISHAVVNLIDNALRHAPGDVTVAAMTTGGSVEIAVSDRGPGVPPRRRLAIVQVGTTGVTGRSGLGLAIAEAFVAAHGSRLVVGDNPGGGARFSFLLPIAGEGPSALPCEAD